MTQAFNLSQLANNLNTSGQLDATDGLTGAVPVANDGTGLTSVGTSGNVLTSNGTSWVSSSIPAPTIADGSVTEPKFGSLSAGDIYSNQFFGASVGRTNTSSYVKVGEARVLRDGTFRLKSNINFSNGSTSSITFYTRIYKNGSAVGTEVSVSVPLESTTSGFYSFGDISFSRGDLLQFYTRISTGSSVTDTTIFTLLAGTSVAPATPIISSFYTGGL